MMPPIAMAEGSDAETPLRSAVSFSLETLSQRADFLKASQARRQSMPAFTLQARRRNDEAEKVRVGFTCSRKIGNAVTRNRAKRRLRALARAVLPDMAQPGWDYVLVGRPGATVDRTFALMVEDLRAAMARIHAPRPAK